MSTTYYNQGQGFIYKGLAIPTHKPFTISTEEEEKLLAEILTTNWGKDKITLISSGAKVEIKDGAILMAKIQELEKQLLNLKAENSKLQDELTSTTNDILELKKIKAKKSANEQALTNEQA